MWGEALVQPHLLPNRSRRGAWAQQSSTTTTTTDIKRSVSRLTLAHLRIERGQSLQETDGDIQSSSSGIHLMIGISITISEIILRPDQPDSAG